MDELHTIARILSSKSRLKIITLILNSKEDLCVNEIAQKVPLSHSAASHQLAKLESAGIVKSHRIGQMICYTAKTSAITKKIKKIISIV